MDVHFRTMASRPFLEREKDAEVRENTWSSRWGRLRPFSSWRRTRSSPKCRMQEYHDGGGLRRKISVSLLCWNIFSPSCTVCICNPKGSIFSVIVNEIKWRAVKLHCFKYFYSFLTWHSERCLEGWCPCRQAYLMLMLSCLVLKRLSIWSFPLRSLLQLQNQMPHKSLNLAYFYTKEYPQPANQRAEENGTIGLS